jgi:hypothetical protein
MQGSSARDAPPGAFGTAETKVGDESRPNERGEPLMKAKLLREAGDISKGTVVEITSKAGTNDARSDQDLGGRSTTEEPVYEVTDTEGHTEKVDTRDLKAEP